MKVAREFSNATDVCSKDSDSSNVGKFRIFQRLKKAQEEEVASSETVHHHCEYIPLMLYQETRYTSTFIYCININYYLKSTLLA